MEVIFFVAIIIIGIVAFNANSRIERLETELRSLRRQLENGFRKPSNIKTQKSGAETATQIPKSESTASVALATTPKTLSADKEPARKTEPKTAHIPFKPKLKIRSFEEEIGARWAVWVGGLTLALGAIFLLRFAVEAGVFSPAMRVGLAALMGITSLGAGEFLRRKDNAFFKDKLKIGSLEQSAYIPGVLTAVGIFTLYGAIYAAYALYGLIPALIAFIGMALVSFVAFGLSLLQGPKIAALGLVGSLITPLLVSSDLSNYPMLYSYLAIVTAASVILSRFKKWGWLALAALFGALFWMWLGSFNASLGKAFWPWSFYSAALFGGAVWISKDHEKTAYKALEPKNMGLRSIEFDVQYFKSAPALIWFGFWAFSLLQLDNLFNFKTAYHVTASLGAAALMGAGFWRKRLSQLILIGGALALAIIFGLAQQAQHPAPLWLISMLGLGALLIGLTALKSRVETNNVDAAIWAGFGVIIPLLFVLSSEIVRNYPDLNIAFMMAGLVIINIGLSCVMPRSNIAGKGLLPFTGSAAFYCAGAAAAYTFCAGYGFEGWPFSFAMMLGVPLSLAAYQFLKEPFLKVITIGFAALTALYVLFIQLPLGTSIGPQIIFNALWFYLAFPSALCAASAWYLIRRETKDDIWMELLKAFALAFAALFAVFQVRHLMNDGNILSNNFAFDEMAMQVLTGLCFTLGGLYLGRKNEGHKASLLSILAIGISVLTLALFILGVCFSHNPLLNTMTLVKGGVAFNSLTLAFLLPAFALAGIAWLGGKTRSVHYLRLCGGLSLVSFMIYVTAMIRRGFSGNMISLFKVWPDDVELYAISAAWLVLGVGLLTLGMKIGRRDIRLASGFVIILTVLKAFLVDMASLEGALRAMSFVVLGVVLIVIGRVYQRILLSDPKESALS